MPREVELSLNEQAFILEALREGVRLDGRPLDAFRDMELDFSDEYGVADVRLGKTRSDRSHIDHKLPPLHHANLTQTAESRPKLAPGW